MYTLLRQGDKLPTVGVLQVLLNRGIEKKKLICDGDFGGNTRTAVRDFQRPRGLTPDGIVGQNTWPRLIAGTGFQIVDSVDITDPDVLVTEAADIRSVGGLPTLVGSMCNGIGQAISELVSRMSQGGEVVLLRFFGHGAPGVMGVSDGTGSVRIGNRNVFLEDQDLSSLTPGTVTAAAGILRLLTPLFGPYSSVQLHGCRVAQGRAGRQMIQELANIWNVPVSASTVQQLAGGRGGTLTFQFEGPVFTACPGGVTLRQWAGNLPAMVEMNVR